MNGEEYAESIRLDKPIKPNMLLLRTKGLVKLHRNTVISNCMLIYLLFWLATLQIYSMFEIGLWWQNTLLIITISTLIIATNRLLEAYIRGEMCFMVRLLGDAIKKLGGEEALREKIRGGIND